MVLIHKLANSLITFLEKRKAHQEFSFNTNLQKIVESIVWVTSQPPGPVDIYKTVKTIFYAEIGHLEKFGRPITGDILSALPFGPVPSVAYDMAKGKVPHLVMSAFERKGDNIIPSRGPNLTLFTRSDIECLSDAWNIIKGKTFSEIKDTTHEHSAYKKAWARKSRFRNSEDMLYSEIIEDPDKLEFLKEYANKIRI